MPFSTTSPFLGNALAQSRASNDAKRTPNFWDVGLDQSVDYQDHGAVQDFTADASAWDKLKLGGLDVPGLVEIRCTKARKVNKRDAPGQNGAVVTHLGFRPAEVTIRVVLWTPGHLINWTQIILTIFPSLDTGPTKIQAFDVDHPALALHNIKSLYVEEISPLAPGRVRGTMESTIRLTEYLDVKAAKIGNFAKSTNGVSGVPQANSPAAAAKNPVLTDAGAD